MEPVYQKEEADKLKIPYRLWTMGEFEKGDWVITNNEYAVQITYKHAYWRHGNAKNPNNKRIIYGGKGLYFTSEQQKYGGNVIYRIGDKTITDYRDKRDSRNLSVMERYWCQIVAKGTEPDLAVLMCFPTNSNPAAKVKTLMKRKKVREYIMAELKDELEKSGLSLSYTFEKTKEMIDKDSTSDKVKKELLETVASWHGIGKKADSGFDKLREIRKTALLNKEGGVKKIEERTTTKG